MSAACCSCSHRLAVTLKPSSLQSLAWNGLEDCVPLLRSIMTSKDPSLHFHSTEGRISLSVIALQASCKTICPMNQSANRAHTPLLWQQMSAFLIRFRLLWFPCGYYHVPLIMRRWNGAGDRAICSELLIIDERLFQHSLTVAPQPAFPGEMAVLVARVWLHLDSNTPQSHKLRERMPELRQGTPRLRH